MGAPSIDTEIAAQVMTMGDAGYGGNEIARRTGLARSSVRDVLDRVGHWGRIEQKPVFAKLRAEQQQHLEAGFRMASAQLLAAALDEEKIAKASTYQLIIASGIALDKSRLLAGESTQIIEVSSKLAVAGLDKFCELLSQSLLPETIDVSPSQTKISDNNQVVST